MRIQCGGGSIEKPFVEKKIWALGQKNVKEQKALVWLEVPVYDERIHNNDECRWQHPELTGIVLWDKVSQHDRHSSI